MDLTQFISSSNEAKSAEELYTLLEQALFDVCGYDRVLFSLMSDHPSLGLREGHGVMRNYPDGWMKHYVEKGYEYIDPVRRFGFRHVGPFIWDALPLVMDLTPQQKICMHECCESGFYNGAAVCLRGLTGELGGIGVANSTNDASDKPEDVRYKLGLFNAIAQQFYVVFCAVHDKRKGMDDYRVVLTSREIEVIRHMARAKKDDCIAHDMNMSRHAVDFHVRNILKKFNAPNRMYAVMRAVNSGILGLDEAVFIRRSSR
ncbi:MAG: autoinducer binding domain-containing protein [Bdellovibrionales bacterium]